MPILWDAPKSDTYAVQDIGMVVDHLRGIFKFTNDPEETLAVLHNKNRLVHAFCRCGWIQDTEGEVLSRSVTSCAGMTAKVTIIAQTRIGFLSGLRRFPGGEGAEDAYDVQIEEAAARATVALTRAKELCVDRCRNGDRKPDVWGWYLLAAGLGIALPTKGTCRWHGR